MYGCIVYIYDVIHVHVRECTCLQVAIAMMLKVLRPETCKNNVKVTLLIYFVEPIKQTNMKFTNKSGSNVSVEVTASGR